MGTRPSWRLGLLTLSLLLSACGQKEKKAKSEAPVFDAGLAAQRSVHSKAKPAEIPRAPQVFDDAGDEAKALDAIGALPAWSAVLERYRLLDRRDQSGVVVGLLVRHEGKLHLVDESEGQGSLSIPVRFPGLLKVTTPSRMVLWGAWKNVEAPNFIWEVSRGELLAPADAAPEFAPGLRGRDKKAPEQVQLASSVNRRGGVISFTVHQRQQRIGEGWLISDSPGLPPVARLHLPGERAPYGDQSRVTENERWQLESSESYWLEIGGFRPASEGALPVYRARTPPFRFTPGKIENAP